MREREDKKGRGDEPDAGVKEGKERRREGRRKRRRRWRRRRRRRELEQNKDVREEKERK